MDIDLTKITVGDLAEGYRDDGDGGVVGYAGRLDIRPAFQREFVYDAKQQAAVIDTLMKGHPLNIMYWSDRGDGRYEIIDGQQRTISLARFVDGAFMFDGRYFPNLAEDERQAVLDYELMVYICRGAESERLAWFETINIAGETLSAQELRNATFSGPWVQDAKRYFTKAGCPAYRLANGYLTGKMNRQDYLATAIKWAAEDGGIEAHMAAHQHDENAEPLWRHFQAVIRWAQSVFPNYRKTMRGIDWGTLYRTYKDAAFAPAAVESRVVELENDEDVTAKKGIFEYILSGDESKLNIRKFPDAIKRAVLNKQGGKCANHAVCGTTELAFEDAEADHMKPWREGGHTDEGNCQVLCRPCNRRKGAR